MIEVGVRLLIGSQGIGQIGNQGNLPSIPIMGCDVPKVVKKKVLKKVILLKSTEENTQKSAQVKTKKGTL